MITTTTTGYITRIFGPFHSDYYTNEASILKRVLLNNYDDILNWLKDNNIVLVNSFRDSLCVLKVLGIDAAMRSFLSRGRRQLDINNTNRSRFVTELRWVVEDVNARLKRFK